MQTHPAERFKAPSTITAGVPLKRILGAPAIALIAESFAPVYRAFDAERFIAHAQKGLSPLSLMQRGLHIAQALAQELPTAFAQAAPILIAALGPPLTKTEANGLAPFFYLPHSSYVATYGPSHFPSGMRVIKALTQRFTSEFAIRPFLIHHQDACVATLLKWTKDKDIHVRRLTSEGSRSRLPWGMRIPAFQKDPTPVLAILEQLKDDESQYVRRSVANHLGDILKDQPTLAYTICQRWAQEVAQLDCEPANNRRWMLRHAVRLAAKRGVKEALAIRQLCAIRKK
jgi:3-methyladenine DNA glycosylase AlkC